MKAAESTPPAATKSRRVLRLACLASFVAFAFASWRAATFYTDSVAASKRRVIDLSVKGAARIDGELRAAMTAAQGMADDLSSGKLPYGRIDARLERTLTDLPELRSGNVAFEPGAYKPGVRLFTPYWIRDQDGLHAKNDPSYDYTKPEVLWYARALASGKPVWLAPYYRKVSNSLTAVYAVPFFKNGKAIGVVSLSLSLDQIRRMVENIDLGPSGFPELTSADGTYLYHPRNEFVIAQKTILNLAQELGDNDRLTVGPRAMRGEAGIIDHISTNTGLKTWFVYQPIPAAGWSLQNTFVRADLPYDVDAMRHLSFRAMLATIVFVLLLLSVCMQIHEWEIRGLWTLSIVSSLLFTAGIGVSWGLALKLDNRAKMTGSALSDMASLERLRNHYMELCAVRHAEPPVFVPTGVFLETARFLDPSDVQVTGYIWQRYNDLATKGLDRGFVLRDASDVKVAEPFRQRQDEEEVLRWPFQATLHQNMDLAAYPLDQEELSLKLRHKDLDHNVVLTPDLGSYKILSAKAKPGLAAEFKIGGWRVLETFFDLGGTIESTTFGLARSVAKEDFPGLRFNVLLRRNLLDAFISNLSAIIIALILLFALQMVLTSDEKLASFMQMTSGRMVNICVSMFFVIVFAHVSVRRGMAAEEIFYLEYFYFITYMMILWVAINSILFFKEKQIRWLRHRENLVLKLLFWPVVTGFLLATSVGTFY